MKNKTQSAGSLKVIPGHKNYYRASNGMIYYKDSTTPKFSTKETAITRAKKVVETKKLEDLGKSGSEIRRRTLGETNPLIENLWEEMVKEIEPDVLKSTLGNYSKDWNVVLKKFWDNKFALDLNEKNFLKFKSWYIENFPGRYARKTIVHFKKFCKWAQKKGYVKSLPDFEILSAIHETTEKFARREKVGRVYKEKTEVLPMIESASKISKDEYLCSMATLGVLLGVRCGLRKMEAMKLKWENVDPKNKSMRVWSTKNHKWRTVPLIDEVLKAFTVQSVFSGVKSPWVFPMRSDAKRHISSQLFDKLWVRVKKKAEIKGRARFHDLRHTFATLTAETGWPPVVACEVLDQSLDVYQKIYCHPSDESIAAQMARTFEKTNENKEEK